MNIYMNVCVCVCICGCLCIHMYMHLWWEMDTETRVEIEAACISHTANTFGKGMNPTTLPLTMGKTVGQTRLFSLGMVTGLGEGKL